MSNPFLDHAERAIPQAVQRKENRAQERAIRKAMKERDQLKTAHRAHWSALRRELIESAPGTDFEGLLRNIDDATEDDGDVLVSVAHLGRGYDERHRQFLLSCIAERCCQIRKLLDLPPFDDPIPFPDNDETNVFLDCKRGLGL